MTGAMDDLLLYQRIYDLILYSFPILNRFPKSQRFVLAQNIQNAFLALAQYVVEANKRTKKLEYLIRADIELEKLRLLIRLAKDLGYFPNFNNYSTHAEKLNEIGRLLGGMLRRCG